MPLAQQALNALGQLQDAEEIGDGRPVLANGVGDLLLR